MSYNGYPSSGNYANLPNFRVSITAYADTTRLGTATSIGVEINTHTRTNNFVFGEFTGLDYYNVYGFNTVAAPTSLPSFYAGKAMILYVKVNSILYLPMNPITYQWKKSIDGGVTWEDFYGVKKGYYITDNYHTMTYYIYAVESAILDDAGIYGLFINNATSSASKTVNISINTVLPRLLTGDLVSAASVNSLNAGYPYTIPTVNNVTTEFYDPNGLDGTFTYQWFRNGTAIPGATSLKYTIASPLAGTHDGIYYLIATYSLDEKTARTNSCTLTIVDAVIYENLNNLYPMLGAEAKLTFKFKVPTIYSTDFRATWRRRSLTTYVTEDVVNSGLIKIGQTNEIGTRPLYTLTLTIPIFNSTHANYTYYVLIQYKNPGATSLNGFGVTSNTVYIKQLVVPFIPNGSYISGPSYEHYMFPSIVEVYVGSSHTFTALGVGNYVLYKWYKNGIEIIGETKTTLTITDIQVSDKYKFQAYNAAGAAYSAECLLRIKPAIFITKQPTNQIGFVGLGTSSRFVAELSYDDYDYYWEEKNPVTSVWSQVEDRYWVQGDRDIISTDYTPPLLRIDDISSTATRYFRLAYLDEKDQQKYSNVVHLSIDTTNTKINNITANVDYIGGTGTLYYIQHYTYMSNDITLTVLSDNCGSCSWNLGVLSNDTILTQTSSPYSFIVKNKDGINQTLTITLSDRGRTISISPPIHLDYTILCFAYVSDSLVGTPTTANLEVNMSNGVNQSKLTNSSYSGPDVAETVSVLEGEPYELKIYSKTRLAYNFDDDRFRWNQYQWKKNGIDLPWNSYDKVGYQEDVEAFQLEEDFYPDGAAVYTIKFAKFSERNVGTYTLKLSSHTKNLPGGEADRISKNHRLEIAYAPPILITPLNANYNITTNDSLGLGVSVDKTGYTFLGQKFISSTWSTIVDGGNISGATTNALVNLNAESSDSGSYRVIITNSHGQSVTSSCIVSVNYGVKITQDLADQYLYAGATLTLSISATLTTGYTYQWYKNGSLLAGKTSLNLSIANISVANGDFASYYIKLTNSSTGNVVTSKTANIGLMVAPNITSQPINATGNLNLTGAKDIKTFSVTATGTQLTYQWQKSSSPIGPWTAIANEISSSLAITISSISDEAYYQAVISNITGSISTNGSAKLTVNLPLKITAQPASATANQGSNFAFSVLCSGTSLTYQWKELISGAWTNISGATSSIYTLNSIAFTAVRTFKVTVSSSIFGTSEDSRIVYLNINSSRFAINSLQLIGANPDQILTNTSVGGGSSYNLSSYVTSASSFSSSSIKLKLNATDALAYDWTLGVLSGNEFLSSYSGNTKKYSVTDKNGNVVLVTVVMDNDYTLTISPIVNIGSSFVIMAYAYSNAAKSGVTESSRIYFTPIDPSVISISFSNETVGTSEAKSTGVSHDFIVYYNSLYSGHSYQWKKNGSNINSATGRTISTGTLSDGTTFVKLSLSSTVIGDSGDYTLVMTDKFSNKITSATHQLIINSNPPVIINPLTPNINILSESKLLIKLFVRQDKCLANLDMNRRQQKLL